VKGVNRYRMDDIRKITGDRMDDLGCMAVLRVKVMKEDVPIDSPLVPIMRQSFAFMKDDIRQTVLSGGTPEEIRRWHSRAADWCIDHDAPMTERLHHLINSERDREASKIVRNYRYLLMDNPDRELTETIGALALRHDDPDIIYIAARMALDVESIELADRLSVALLRTDPLRGRGMRCEILLRMNQIENALMLARYHYRGDIDTGLALGICLLESYHPEDAAECLERTRIQMVSEGCVFRLDELIMYEAAAHICMRNNERARALIDAAISFTRSRRRKDLLLTLKEGLRSEDCILLESVQI
jgi:hypothetical protein